ncbi:hypothetical protein CBR_g17709 [Chara braunii]|uniref:Serine aminopeptidase S33 domain-containing protein n=1 Tax=Chara braunii TaxID=69332 RepID=A0A388KVC1_CHABU|nr:hypothetical protein CBR_g17709 [Chara braunii]|eukprot:GBG73999.1 hypothetical protein CBR_g17709 [Chara braunii]
MMEQLVNFVIRPPRAEYTPAADLLGPIFNLKGRKYKRVDLQLVNARGHLLVCSHYMPWPPPDVQQPCVIYCHGNSGCRADANEAVVVLLPCNITVFTLDFSGSGLSEGDYVSLGWYERDDLDCVVSHLRAEGKTSNIGLWGRSMGAVTSLMFGAMYPSVAGLVLDSPFSRLNDLMMELVDMYRIRVPKFTVKMVVQYMKRAIQKKAGFDIMELDTLALAPQCFIPALFGHATSDAFILPHHSEDIYSAYAGDKNIIKFEGDHNSQRPQFYYDSISIFFYNVLNPPDLPGCSLTDYVDEDDPGTEPLVDQATLYELLINSQGVAEDDDDDDDEEEVVLEGGEGGATITRAGREEGGGVGRGATAGAASAAAAAAAGATRHRSSRGLHRRWTMSRTEIPTVNGDMDGGEDEEDALREILSSMGVSENSPESALAISSASSPSPSTGGGGVPSSGLPSRNRTRSSSSSASSLPDGGSGGCAEGFAPTPISIDQEDAMYREALEASLKDMTVSEGEGGPSQSSNGDSGGSVGRDGRSASRVRTGDDRLAGAGGGDGGSVVLRQRDAPGLESSSSGSFARGGDRQGPREGGGGGEARQQQQQQQERIALAAEALPELQLRRGRRVEGGEVEEGRGSDAGEGKGRGAVDRWGRRNELLGLKTRTAVKVGSSSDSLSLGGEAGEGNLDRGGGVAVELLRAEGRERVGGGSIILTGRGREWREEASSNKPVRVKSKERAQEETKGGRETQRTERKSASGGRQGTGSSRDECDSPSWRDKPKEKERESARRRSMSNDSDGASSQRISWISQASGSSQLRNGSGSEDAAAAAAAAPTIAKAGRRMDREENGVIVSGLADRQREREGGGGGNDGAASVLSPSRSSDSMGDGEDRAAAGRSRQDQAVALVSASGRKEKLKDRDDEGGTGRGSGIFSSSGAVNMKKRAMEVMAAMVGRSASGKEREEKGGTPEKSGMTEKEGQGR